MKILKRNYGHRNLIIFLVLSLVYLQSISALFHGDSIFSIVSLRSFFIDHFFVLLLTGLTAYMVMTVKKWSQIMLLFCLIIIVGKSFILLSDSFNKLTLVLNFIYLLFAFYFFVTWELEVELASFNPLFSKYDLEKESRFKLTANISTHENGDDSIKVHITNIDQESCFLLLPKDSHFSLLPSLTYYLDSNYEGIHFRHQASLVSAYDRGIGLMFENYPDARVSWSELYKVCLERGLVG